MRTASLLNRGRWLLFAALIALLVSNQAHATNILDSIGNQYKGLTGGWQTSLFDIAKSLFLKLALLEIVWSGLWWVIARDDPERMMSNVLKKIMGLMFFWAILLNFSNWIPAVVNGFSAAGQAAAHIGPLTPSSVMDTGLQISTSIFSNVSFNIFADEGLLTAIVGAFAGILILVAFTVIAGQMLVTLIESYIAISAGVLFLGFAGSRWTTTFAEKYISYTVSIGVKLFVTYLIIGAGQQLSTTWVTLISAGTKMTDFLPVVGGAIVFMFLCWQIPAMASSMLTGAVSMTLGGAAATAASVGAAGAGAVGAVAAGAAGAVGAAKGVAGAAAGIGKLAGAAAGAAKAGGASGPMSMISGAIGATAGAVGGAVAASVKGLGQNSAGGKLAERISSGAAGLADSKAMSAGGNVAAPATGGSSGATGGASSGAGTSGGGAPGSAVPAPSASIPANSQSKVIDTSTSVSQAVQQRDTAGSSATRGTPAAPSGASGAADTATGAGATYPTAAGATPSQPSTPGANQNTQQPKAPPKSTMERLRDSASAMSQTPNDSASGAGVQIDLKHHKD